MFLSVVIPAYNEEVRIGATLEKLKGFVGSCGFSCEVIIVDDGSTDRTVSVIEEFSRSSGFALTVIRNKKNRGKGYSVRRGVFASAGDFILLSDADLSTPLEEAKAFFPYFEHGYDIVIGSRSLEGARLIVRQPWYREKMGKIFNLFVRAVAIRGLKDTQCGFKVFRRQAACSIFSLAKIDRFAFDVEALFLARQYGYRIQDIPVVWINSPHSKVHIVVDSFRMIVDTLRIIVYHGRPRRPAGAWMRAS